MARPVPGTQAAFNDNAPPPVTVEKFLAYARAGFAEDVKKILKRQPGLIDQADTLGDTALIEAVRNKRYDVIDILLEAGAKPDKANNATFTPLILAIMEHDVKMVTQLLKAKANPDIRVDTEITALMLATVQGDDDIVEKLLEHNAAKELTDDLGNTAFMLAIANGMEKIARRLKESGANINARDLQGNSSLDKSINLKRNDAMFDLLIELGADFLSGNTVSADVLRLNTTPAMWAAGADNTYALQKLKDIGAPVDTSNAYGMTPVIFAAANGSYNTARQLVGWEVSLLSPDRRHPGARRLAEQLGHRDIVNLFDLVNGRKVAVAVSNAQIGGEGAPAPQKAAFKKRPPRQAFT